MSVNPFMCAELGSMILVNRTVVTGALKSIEVSHGCPSIHPKCMVSGYHIYLQVSALLSIRLPESCLAHAKLQMPEFKTICRKSAVHRVLFCTMIGKRMHLPGGIGKS